MIRLPVCLSFLLMKSMMSLSILDGMSPALLLAIEVYGL